MNTPITEADLHAYADGLLADGRRSEIDRYLTGRPEEAERIRAYRDQNAALRALFNPVADEQIPSRLLDAAMAPSSRRARHPLLQRLAAGVAIAFLGAIAGWMAHAQLNDAPILAWARQPGTGVQVASLAHQAAVAHAVYSRDLRRPVEIGAEQEDQLVTWLSKRLGAKIRAPKLGPLGYELIGGRLLPGAVGPVAQFMYQDSSGQRLTLYVTNENTGNADSTGFRFAQQGPVNVFYWIDGKFGYALSAGADRGTLARIATAVYDQLEQK
ncbi:anti-sigma factor family protein [Noviherbaspirillum massiliense]|uniref:anti-sigma factor family protein n=1 Tax=Noviherbaspirillum massiliense TaxID=1465823 RepID=UPI0002FB6AB8|nr:anti-sigma factor [Noviherbaspirillum massiliense]